VTDLPAAAPGAPADDPARASAGRRVVVGIGAPDRGDDAVGPAVVREVAELLAATAGSSQGGPGPGAAPTPGEVECVEREDPSALMDLWHGVELCVVVDAVVSGASPGTLHEVATGADVPPLPARGRHVAGTHDFGLGTAVELARALGRLPGRVVVVGVEAASFDHGAPLHPAVAAAVGRAADRVLEVLARPGRPA
jgi:hydrogenase maturation protease